MVNENEHIEDLNDQMIVRREKMEELRENGVNPFGDKFERTHFSTEVIKRGTS